MAFLKLFWFVAVVLFIGYTEAGPVCNPMKKERKKIYEDVFGRDFMGCAQSHRDALVVLKRMNWLMPVSEPSVAMRRDATFPETGKEVLNEKKMKVMKKGLKMADAALQHRGMLMVSTECLSSLEPDFIVEVEVEFVKEETETRFVPMTFPPCRPSMMARLIESST